MIDGILATIFLLACLIGIGAWLYVMATAYVAIKKKSSVDKLAAFIVFPWFYQDVWSKMEAKYRAEIVKGLITFIISCATAILVGVLAAIFKA